MTTGGPEKFRFGKYYLHSRLARGGMAEIFLASPAAPGHEDERLVIKRLLPALSDESDFLQMFLEEARLASQLIHPNVVRILDLGFESGHLYLAMEFIDGEDLEDLTRKRKRVLPPNVAARIAMDVCSALAYAHSATGLGGAPLKVVHRDVTPENVMLDRRGVVKLVDFGVAKATARLGLTKPGVVKGKLSYLAPEHIKGLDLDGRADLFSFGASLYEITTGIKPFERTQLPDTVAAILSESPPAPASFAAGYPPALSAIVMRALEKDRDRRYPGAREMRADLERFLATCAPVTTEDLARLVGGEPQVPVRTERVATPQRVARTQDPERTLDSQDGKPAATELEMPLVSPPGFQPEDDVETKPQGPKPQGPKPRPSPSPDDFAPSQLHPVPAGMLGEDERSTDVTNPLRQRPQRGGDEPRRHPVAAFVAKALLLLLALAGAAWGGRYSASLEFDRRLAALQAAVVVPAGPDAAAAWDAEAAGPDAAVEPDAALPESPDAAEPDAALAPGILEVVAKGQVEIGDKGCRGSCTVRLPPGEYAVRLAGKKRVEKRVVVRSGEKTTVRLP